MTKQNGAKKETNTAVIFIGFNFLQSFINFNAELDWNILTWPVRFCDT